jgi:hypothetical protein
MLGFDEIDRFADYLRDAGWQVDNGQPHRKDGRNVILRLQAQKPGEENILICSAPNSKAPTPRGSSKQRKTARREIAKFKQSIAAAETEG